MAVRKKLQTTRRLLYWLRYRIGECFLRAFVFVLPRIPRRLLALLISVAARLAFVLLRQYRTRMEQNFTQALGSQFSLQQRKHMVRRAWRNFARGFYETTSALFESREKICAAVAIQGEEYLKQALAKKRGVIGLSAHLGNFTMIGIRLAASGYPYSVVVKQPRDLRLARLIDRYRAWTGVSTIPAKPRREAARRILTALKKNEVVLLIADEFKSGGIEVEFLGRKVPVPRGPATLALRSGAPVVPLFVTRDSTDRLVLRIEPEVALVRTGDLQSDVAANAALLTARLEAMVLRYPDQWSWLGFQRNGRGPGRRAWDTPRASHPPTQSGSL